MNISARWRSWITLPLATTGKVIKATDFPGIGRGTKIEIEGHEAKNRWRPAMREARQRAIRRVSIEAEGKPTAASGLHCMCDSGRSAKPRLFTKLTRRDARHPAEGAAEMRRVGVAGGKGDVDDPAIGVAQKPACILVSDRFEYVRIGQAEMGELALKRPRADARDLGDVGQSRCSLVEIGRQHQLEQFDDVVAGRAVLVAPAAAQAEAVDRLGRLSSVIGRLIQAAC